MRLTYVLQHWVDLRKAHTSHLKGTSSRGKTWPGYKQYLENRDVTELAAILTSKSWSGRKATSAVFDMAAIAFAHYKIKSYTQKEQFDLGRVLLSAFVYAEIYRLEPDDDAPDSPMYVVDIDSEGWEGTIPHKTQFKPFKPWESNTDEHGNQLVKPSWPCPPRLQEVPDIDRESPWFKAVLKLENTAFRINKQVLNWAVESDKKLSTRLIPHEPPGYKKKREELDKRRKTQRIDHIKELRDQDKELRSKDKKANKSIIAENKKRRRKKLSPLPLQRSKGYHTTEKQDRTYVQWWRDHNALEQNRWRTIDRRSRFERDLEWAKTLAAKDRPFYQRVSLDYRGRMYLPEFSYQGSDFCRGVIEFDKSSVMTEGGSVQLVRHLANTKGTKKLEIDKLEEGAHLIPEALDIALDPIENWSAVRSADSPFCYLRACLEVRNIVAAKTLDGQLGGPDDAKEEAEWREIYDAAEKCVVDRGDFVEGALITSGREQLASHLPVAADQHNSAFQHIGLIMGSEGEALLQRITAGEDIYQTVGDYLTEVPKKHRRAIAKMIIVPWSYGGTKYSCKKKVSEWRREHPGEIEFLDNLTASELTVFVNDVFDTLEKEFKECIQYQKGMKESVQRMRKEHPNKAIKYQTHSGFIVTQRVHKVKKDPLRGKVVRSYEEDSGKVQAQEILNDIDWSKMGSKFPPNFVHSMDASLIHLLLSGSFAGRAGGGDVNFDPLVTVHDSISCLPLDSAEMIMILPHMLAALYGSDEKPSKSKRNKHRWHILNTWAFS